jgi:molybdate transport system ATP-binding protein
MAGLHVELKSRSAAFDLDAAFSVQPNECVALVGATGAGTTTCLQMIAGLMRPQAGHVRVGDEILYDTTRGIDVPPRHRRVGMLFQDYALFPHLSVHDNVAFGARARGASLAPADQWLEALGLRELARRRVNELSGGQRQRVALARALAAGSRTLLLDEPFSALDLVTRAAVRSELRAFLAEAGLPTVFVTHDPVDARVFGDRLVILDAGKVVQEGTWEQIAHAPRSGLAAELAGLNLYRAALPGGNDLSEVTIGSVALHVLPGGLAGEAWLAFEPGEVVLSNERPQGSSQNVLAGRVVEVVPLAGRLRVRLDVGVPLTAEITRKAADSLHVVAGATLWASIKATAIRSYT